MKLKKNPRFNFCDGYLGRCKDCDKLTWLYVGYCKIDFPKHRQELENKRTFQFKDLKHPNVIKIMISGLLPVGVFMYFYLHWFQIIGHKVNQMTGDPHIDPFVYSTVIVSWVAPLWLAFPIFNAGLSLSELLGFIKNKYPWEFDNEQQNPNEVKHE